MLATSTAVHGRWGECLTARRDGGQTLFGRWVRGHVAVHHEHIGAANAQLTNSHFRRVVRLHRPERLSSPRLLAQITYRDELSPPDHLGARRAAVRAFRDQ